MVGGCGILGVVGALRVCAFTMVLVVQLVERPVVVREVAGSSPVKHPVVSHGVDGRVGNPELVPFGQVRGFPLLSQAKMDIERGCWVLFWAGVRRDRSPFG